MNSPLKIGIITDVHYGPRQDVSRRRYHIAHILVERAVRRLNLMIKPDIVLVLGDLVDNGSDTDAEERLLELRKILNKLDCPYLAIPGNHDDSHEQFYRVFDRPGEWEDVAGARFLGFVDRDEPGYNSSRSDEDIDRFYKARADFNGPLIAFQHVCLYPPEPKMAPYNYLNAENILSAMKEVGVTASISGHHHHGVEPVEVDGTTLVTAPGLCESPFPITEIVVDGMSVDVKRHNLAMPPELKLVDTHLHTQLAYCSENMDVGMSIELAKEFGLAGMRFTEHSAQLYYDRKPFGQAKWLEHGINNLDPAANRIEQYLELKRQYEDDFALFSLEADCAKDGRLVLKPEDSHHFTPVVGAIHSLPGLSMDLAPSTQSNETFLFLVESMCKQGISSLAHPMRIFRRCNWDAPVELFEPTAKLLKQYGVAAEINYHTNLPHVEFIKLCLDLGVKFTFASDSHNLAEIGDFAPHLSILAMAGFDGDLADIMHPLPVG